MMTSNADDAKDELYLSMMRMLEVSPDTIQRDLAKRLGISLVGKNYCLKARV